MLQTIEMRVTGGTLQERNMLRTERCIFRMDGFGEIHD